MATLGRSRLLRAVALLRTSGAGAGRSDTAAAVGDAAGLVAAASLATSGPGHPPLARCLSVRATSWDLHYQQRVQQISDLALVGRLLPHRKTLAPTFTPHSVMLLPDWPGLGEAQHEDVDGLLADSVKRKRRAKIKKVGGRPAAGLGPVVERC